VHVREAVAIAVVGLVLVTTGCGGGGLKAVALEPGADELLVGFWSVAGFGMCARGCEITRSGRCRYHLKYAHEGDPLGIFETKLSASQVAAIAKAVKRAAQAGLQAQYGTGPPDSGAVRITFHENGELRTIEMGHYGGPEELRPLYQWGSGLIVDAMEAAHKHPLHTVALRHSLPKTHYQVNEPIKVHLAVANVGPQAAGFPSIDCEEVVYGWVSAAVHITGRLQSPWKWIDIGGELFRYPGALTPLARRDLANILTLAPGEEYRFLFPKRLRADRPGSHRVSASYDVWLRYNAEEVEAEVGVPVITGELHTGSLPIEVRD
jgi:hypothetical protein